MMQASFEEKSVWVQLVGVVLAMGFYFLIAGRMLLSGVTELPAYAGLLLAATIWLVITQIVGHIIVALASRNDPPDERDRLIAWRAEHGSSWLVATGVFAALTCMVLGFENVWTANILLLSLALSELLGFALRISYYRRGV
jgi:hypothetical protein